MKTAVVVPIRCTTTPNGFSGESPSGMAIPAKTGLGARRQLLAASKSSKRLRPGRELHLVDVENLLGGTFFTADHVGQLRLAYSSATNMASDAHVVLGASASGSALAAGLGWPGARLLLRHGRDGADLELANVLEHEEPSVRFDQVFIASGDGLFAPLAARLGAQGVMVTVVARRHSLANTLRMAAGRVAFVGDSGRVVDSPRAPGATSCS